MNEQLTEVGLPALAAAWSPTLGIITSSSLAFDLRDDHEVIYMVEQHGTIRVPENLALLAMRDRRIHKLEQQFAALSSTLKAHMERGERAAERKAS